MRRAKCKRSFRYFLKWWKFKNRETGQVTSFEDLWPGQALFADLMERETWIYALKAGKLGFTELECAYDAWCALFRHENARVHVFSQNLDAAKQLLEWVKFGLANLPDWLSVVWVTKAGGETATSLIFRGTWMESWDERSVWSYPAAAYAAISQSCTHSHVDELSHMADGKAVWDSVPTTVEPGGSCHVVTRGAGDAVYSYELWMQCKEGAGRLVPFFVPWTGRPDRDPEWKAAQAGDLTSLGLAHFAPDTEDDALMGDDVSPYIPIEVWDRLGIDIPPLDPGEACVIALDSAVTADNFGMLVVTRHPERENEAVIRGGWVWKPGDFADKRIDFEQPRLRLLLLTTGGCRHGHPRAKPTPECALCQEERWEFPAYNVVQVTYDPYQLEDFTQDMKREAAAWFDAFDQGTERLVGDGNLYRMAMSGTVHWANVMKETLPDLREHIKNCKAKLQPEEESRMRIVKKTEKGKVDLAVCAAMGVKRLMELNL